VKKNILGLDLGTTTLGVAISRSGLLVSGYENFRFNNGRYDLALEEVERIVKEENVQAICIGYPLQLSGKVSAMAVTALGFARLIEESTGLKVELIDERWSTKEATRILQDGGKDGFQRKEIIDETAAKLILETYLDKLRLNDKSNEDF